MMDISTEIHVKRIQQGMTLKDIERKSGVLAQAINHWELGKNEPMFRNVEAVFDALGYELVLREKRK